MAKNDLLHGNTELLVLSLLDAQDMYGYQIIRELKQRSENVFELKEGSVGFIGLPTKGVGSWRTKKRIFGYLQLRPSACWNMHKVVECCGEFDF